MILNSDFLNQTIGYYSQIHVTYVYSNIFLFRKLLSKMS